MDGNKQFYLPVDGHNVPVSKKVHDEWRKFERKERYFSVDLKTESFSYDPKKRTATFIPAREDSYERLLEEGEQFGNPDEELPEDVVVKADLLERLILALDALSPSERRLIEEFFYLEMTEREISAKLGIAPSTLRDRKNKILRKLRNVVD